MSGNPDFPLFQLNEEHEELLAAIRALYRERRSRRTRRRWTRSPLPEGGAGRARQSGFNAVHVPEAYDGQGADSVAACIVIEEVARVCGSSSLIPAVNKLGTMGLILKGSEELKKQVAARDSRGAAMASYAPVRARGRIRRASRGTRAKADATSGSSTVPSADHQRRSVHVVHGDGCDRPRQGCQRHLRVHGAQGRRGLRRGDRSSTSSASRAPPPPSCTSRTAAFREDRIIGRALAPASRRPSRRSTHTRPTIGAQALVSRRARSMPPSIHQGPQAVSAVHSRDFQKTQFMLATWR